MAQVNVKMSDPHGILILLARQPLDEDVADLYDNVERDRFVSQRMSLYQKIKKLLRSV